MPKQNPKEARDVQKRLESRLVKPKQKRPSLRKYMPVGVIIGAFVIVASLIFIYQNAFITPEPSNGNTGTPLTSVYTDINGNTIPLTYYRGKVVIIYFHSLINDNTAGPNAALARIEDDYSEIVILTITMDPDDSNNELKEWRSDLGANWILIRDDNVHDYCAEFDFHMPPYAVIVDQNGYYITLISNVNGFNSMVRTQIVALT